MIETDRAWDDLRTRLNRYVRRKVDVDASEDLVHDILLRVLQNEKTLSDADNPIAWIYTVAKNRIADYYRKQSRVNLANDSNLLEDEYADTETPTIGIDKDFADCLRPLTARLEPKYREALQLVDFNEMKQAEAANQIGISLSGMKSRVQRARIKLKEELLACCAIERDRFGEIIDYKKKDGGSEEQCC